MQKLNRVLVALGLASASALSMATAPDYSPIGAGIDVTTVVAAIIAMGVIKAGPNVAKWATNKLASFFR